MRMSDFNKLITIFQQACIDFGMAGLNKLTETESSMIGAKDNLSEKIDNLLNENQKMQSDLQSMENMESWAEDEHNIWSHWMQYMFSKGTLNKDGTWTMPKWAVDRWVLQMNTNYSDLSEDEKQSDRNVVEEWHSHNWNFNPFSKME